MTMAPKYKSKIVTITLNWNGLLHTLQCLRSLKKSKIPVDKIVVDNFSQDDSVKYIEKYFPEVNIVKNSNNLGYSKGYNSGIKKALDGDYEFFIIHNNDVVIHSEAIQALVKQAQKVPEVGVISGKVYHYNDSKRFQYVGGRSKNSNGLLGSPIGANEIDRGQFDYTFELENADDVLMLVKREVIEKVGMYSPKFFLYFEETDWCERIKRAGYKLQYIPDSIVWHKGSVSTGGGINPVKLFWYTRNSYVFAKRNLHFSLCFNFLLNALLSKFPVQLISYIVKNRLNLLLPLIKGHLSGLKALINTRSLIYYDN